MISWSDGWSQSVPDFTILEKGCVGEVVQITNTTQISSGDTLSYNWIIGDTAIGFSNKENPTYTWQSRGTYAIRLIIENQKGDTVQIEKEISIKQVPKNNFVWDNACEGIPVNFTANEQAEDTFGQVDYIWSFGDSMQKGREVEHLYDSVGMQSVKLEVISDYGCSDTSSKTLEIKKFIKVDFEFQNVCEGEEVCFTNLTGDTLKNYWWSFGDGAESYEYSPCHTYAEAKVYNVTLRIIHDGCRDQLTKQVIVHPLPDASFVYRKNSNHWLRVDFTGPFNNDLYRWTFEGGGKSTDQNPMYDFKDNPNGKEVCLATKKGNCWSIECVVLNFSGGAVKDKVVCNMILAYPNPTNGLFTLKTSLASDVYLTDMLGKRIAIADPKINGEGYQVDMGDAHPGIYTVHYRVDNTYFLTRIIKE
jgi:PKD repeat protein